MQDFAKSTRLPVSDLLSILHGIRFGAGGCFLRRWTVGEVIHVGGPTDVVSSGVMPPGRYVMVIEEVIHEASKTSGNPMMTVDYGCYDGTGVRVGGVRDYIPLIKSTEWKLFAFLHAVGIRKSSAFDLDLDELYGKRCGGDVIVEEYTTTAGETREKNKATPFPIEDWEGEVPELQIKVEGEPGSDDGGDEEL